MLPVVLPACILRRRKLPRHRSRTYASVCLGSPTPARPWRPAQSTLLPRVVLGGREARRTPSRQHISVPRTSMRAQIPLNSPRDGAEAPRPRAAHRAPLLASTYSYIAAVTYTIQSLRSHRPAVADTHGPAKRANYTRRKISSANPLRAPSGAPPPRGSPRSRYLCAGFPKSLLTYLPIIVARS